jgi:hypothetical protein
MKLPRTLARAQHRIEERAGKSVVGGFASYVFTTWLDHVIYLFSVLASLVSLPFGPKGSPSLVKDSDVPAP